MIGVLYRAGAQATWLRQHGANERSFGRLLQKFFERQANQVADEVTDFGSFTPDMVPLVFQADDWHQKLVRLARRQLTELMATSAVQEARALERRRERRKQLDSEEELERFGLDVQDVLQLHLEAISPSMAARIRQAVDESMRQPHWRRVTDTVAADIGGIIKGGLLEEGIAPSEMARRIRDQLGGAGARKRAMRIARTETTSAMNAGHLVVIEDVAQSDIVLGKEWSAIPDLDVRDSHLALNGQVVQVSADFDVGGYPAAHPGHWSLPAHERVNCRCVVLTAVATETEAASF